MATHPLASPSPPRGANAPPMLEDVPCRITLRRSPVSSRRHLPPRSATPARAADLANA
ncbi:uncharacterized protein LAESUDRAFT_765122 [Laetiporus sulphureus 93-53]|uniref:Uncharacterized protein n=1 Tax=Laetiporus sulphureus 93-53 TaxID=1314785 RepID=A0A165AY36_9APHY|nr:uncharacterized protein LAESUDRAFT_765122 [Laetiporus sulphureus 93-53]KZS99875.1 hypothetical protein LAESUDRAFT_765122 [Laetiporus sulphureus 93-53]